MRVDFENPLSVSIGDSVDFLHVNFIKPELFVSKDSGKALNQTEVSKGIPKQFPSEAELSITEFAS